MLEKYRPLIYATKEEGEKVKQEAIESVIRNWSKEISRKEVTREEIIQSINEKDNKYDPEYFMELAIREGDMLFEKVAEKFGYKLWNGKAWRNKTCKRTCPLSSACKKELVQIDNEYFCYGQLLAKKIYNRELHKIAETHLVQLLNSDGTIIVNFSEALANDDVFRVQLFQFDDFEDLIEWFGEESGTSRRTKVIGRSAINRYIRALQEEQEGQ